MWFPRNTVTRHSLGAKAKTTLTYKSSNTKIATVDSKGKVTIKAAGTVKITINAKATSTYKAATAKVLTIKIAKKAPDHQDKDRNKEPFLQRSEEESTGIYTWHFCKQQRNLNLQETFRIQCSFRKQQDR